MEAVILLIDVGQTSGQEDENGRSFLSKSKQCASRIIQRKIFSDAKDQFGLILIGSENSENDLDYLNICVKNKFLTLPNWNMLKDIESLSVTEVDHADWLDGLIVAINLLKHETEGKKFAGQKIVMMSNFALPIKAKDQIDDVITTMEDLKINLVVIGPESEDEEHENSEGASSKTKSQRKGEALIGRIVDETNGVICGFDEAMTQLDHFHRVMARAAPWYCDLQIGEKIFIPMTGYKKFAPKPLLKWKKRSIGNTAVTQETVFFQGDEQVENTDVIKSFLFGQTVVPVSDVDKTSMTMATVKSCLLVGFTKRKNVPRHISLGDSAYYIAPRSNIQGSNVAVTALVKALLELEMVAIVRKVYCKNSAPRLGALIPTCEEGAYFFYYVQLPFAEDERAVRLPSLSKVQPSQAQLDAVDALIDDMDLTQFDEEEELYSKFVNPSVEYTNSLVVVKGMNPNAKLPTEPPDSIKNLMKPKLEVLEHVSTALENIKTLFHLEEIEQKTYRRGAADVFDSKSTDIQMEIEDNKPQILADTMAGLVQSAVTEVGTVDPEGNFLKLLELGEPFSKLCEQLQTAIRKLFLTSNNASGVLKPLSALTLLRKHCIKQDFTSYNHFIASLKDDLTERDHNGIWSLICKDKLGLITSEETKESQISTEEADVFYQMTKYESQSEPNYEMEAEDMLDMI